MSPIKPSDGSLATERLNHSQSQCTIITLKKIRLVVTDGPDQGRDLLFDHTPVQIGTHADNDFVLSDRAVSKRHATIERRGEGYVLRDLGSTNGTFVGDVQIQEVFLSPGTLLKLGQTSIKFHPRDEDLVVLPSVSDAFHGMIGQSAKMRQVMGVLERVAATNVSVVIYGETGTGKELAARALHEASPRARHPLVVFDCGNVDPEFIRSELFGHEIGAFTGATTQRVGAFEQANGGTLFIDEIGELPLDLQPKFLRVLEQREIQRLGSNQPRKIDVRIVCATHRNLEEMVRDGKFREDLFYRLCQVPLTLPPLRERREDIPKLIARFLELAQPKGKGRTSAEFVPEAIEVLKSAEWRGNVRELRNAVERAMALAGSPSIGVGDLLMHDRPALQAGGAGGPALVNRSLEDVEREAILQTLKANGGNRKKTARILGIAPVTLREKLRKYGLDSAASPDETEG